MPSAFSGLPFIPYLDNLPNFNRSADGPIRLPIVDKYKVQIKMIVLKREVVYFQKAVN